MSATVSASDVKALRDRTGAGFMDAKAALQEAGGDAERAIEILRVKGHAQAAKRAGRGTAEGVVASYIHANKKVGSLVEVQCETDFVARNEEFQDFAYQVALHIAAAEPHYVSREEIPQAAREAERSLHEQKAREEGKPEEIVERIADGQINKWSQQVCLLEQRHVNAERFEDRTIEELRAEIAAKTGENVRIARFARFLVGEE